MGTQRPALIEEYSPDLVERTIYNPNVKIHHAV